MKELITVATQEKLSRLIHEVCIFELLAIVVKLRQRERYFYGTIGKWSKPAVCKTVVSLVQIQLVPPPPFFIGFRRVKLLNQ